MFNEANNRHMFDFNFTLGIRTFKSFLKKKKSFLVPTNKRRRSEQNRGLEIDLKVHPSKYEPFEFTSVHKRGIPCSSNACTSPILPSIFNLTKYCIHVI